jgi:hypothetical protein
LAARKAAGRHANLALCPTHGSLTRSASDFANSISSGTETPIQLSPSERFAGCVAQQDRCIFFATRIWIKSL